MLFDGVKIQNVTGKLSDVRYGTGLKTNQKWCDSDGAGDSRPGDNSFQSE